MYPDGFATRITPEGPATAGLEDKFRPHFFGGVATVVGKLFTQCQPDFALFGQKDYQQLKVVTRMALDLDLGVKVIGMTTVRERDGLAMSSRNVYLSPEQRQTATVLYRTMKDAKKRIRAGDDLANVMADGTKTIAAAGFNVDYFEARHAETLAPVSSMDDGPLRTARGCENRQHAPDRQRGGLKQTQLAQFAAHRFRHRLDAGCGLAEVRRHVSVLEISPALKRAHRTRRD